MGLPAFVMLETRGVVAKKKESRSRLLVPEDGHLIAWTAWYTPTENAIAAFQLTYLDAHGEAWTSAVAGATNVDKRRAGYEQFEYKPALGEEPVVIELCRNREGAIAAIRIETGDAVGRVPRKVTLGRMAGTKRECIELPDNARKFAGLIFSFKTGRSRVTTLRSFDLAYRIPGPLSVAEHLPRHWRPVREGSTAEPVRIHQEDLRLEVRHASGAVDCYTYVGLADHSKVLASIYRHDRTGKQVVVTGDLAGQPVRIEIPGRGHFVPHAAESKALAASANT